MRIALIADTFPPLRTSGAVQLRDLSREFIRQGHSLCVLLPAPDQSEPWRLDEFEGIQVLRLKAPRTKEISYARRMIAELVMPFSMLRNFRKSPHAEEYWEGIIWYSPSIFHGPLVRALKNSSRCKSYLIIRDIFPEWAVDMGLMGRGLVYWFFNSVARYQYSIADVIGIQTLGNRKYFDAWLKKSGRQLEVLHNWLDRPSQVRCSIRINRSALAGRKLFLYAGNMGVAQGLDIFLDLAQKMRSRADVGFIFVGRGSEVVRLQADSKFRQLDNVTFFDEIDPDEIPDLYAQCHAGIIALDSRHKTHNIPGKFLTYLQCGLPVLANINTGNDLAQMIRSERVGQVCESNDVAELFSIAEKLLEQIETDSDLPIRCRALFDREFQVEKTVKQITTALC